MSGPVSSLISRLETLLETRSSLLETRNSKLKVRDSKLETLDSKISPRRFSSFEFPVSSRVVRVSSDCQLTFDRYCIHISIKVTINIMQSRYFFFCPLLVLSIVRPNCHICYRLLFLLLIAHYCGTNCHETLTVR